uniref:Uncharacterized protein n=1 Tax=Paramormyrops kingsleyae TaxID=1676925 RepID=A0A3B3RXH3_9TELE
MFGLSKARSVELRRLQNCLLARNYPRSRKLKQKSEKFPIALRGIRCLVLFRQSRPGRYINSLCRCAYVSYHYKQESWSMGMLSGSLERENDTHTP